jgi:hypothetical protein
MRTARSALLAGIVLLANGLVWAPPVEAATPTPVDDAAVVQKDSVSNTIDVLANDSPAAGQTISAATDPANGSVTIAGDGLSLTYTPDAGYTGPDTFDYTVHDPADGDASATVTIRVNAPPVAVDDPASPDCNPDPSAFGGSFPIVEDYGQFVLGAGCGPSANDSDADGSIVSWQIDSFPTHGTLDWMAGIPGFVGYTPDANWSTPEGDWVSDSFSYHVIDDDGASSNTATYRIWLAPVNDPPTFTPGALTISSPENSSYSAVWATNPSPGPANESDQTVHYVISDNPGNDLTIFSTLPAIADDGVLSFVPAADRTGTVHLNVVAQDDGGLNDYGGNVGGDPPDDTSDPVSLTITITNVDQPPVAVDDDAALTEDDSATAIDVLANDSDPDGDPLHVTSVTQGTKGSVAITGLGSAVSYTPNADANGSDSFTYTIDDGQGGTATATVDVTIAPVEDDPDAVDDVATVSEDQPTASTVTVLANDTDVDGDALTVTAKTNGAKGTVAIAAGGGSVTYKPSANAFGTDTFTYTVADGHGGADTATVSVTISPVNDPPNAVNDPGPYTVYLKAPALAIPVLANDTSLPDGPETLTITSVTQGSHGAVAITGGGTGLTYAATGSALGLDVFTYTISDGHGGTDTASVQVTVAADTSKPVAAITAISKNAIPSHPSSIRVTLRWTLTDTGSGLASELLQRRTDGGTWLTIPLPSIKSRSISIIVARGHAYSFRVRGTDRAGNVGTFSTRSLAV